MTVSSGDVGKLRPGGKIVITSSGAGLLPIPAIPQYTASKHALIGLVRSLGASEGSLEANIRINALCPAIVATGFALPALLEKIPTEKLTPMRTILRCYDELVKFGDVGQEDWVCNGRTAEVVEGNGNELIWHYPPKNSRADGEGKSVRDKGAAAAAEAYRERNRKFALENEQTATGSSYTACLRTSH